jgi:Uncharacterised nucleotidyltransferase
VTERPTQTAPSTGPLDTFRLDVQCMRIASALAAAGIEPIVLKGPAFDQLLFDGARAREYSDIDLLVDPTRREGAEKLLEQLGFRRAAVRAKPPRPIERAGLAVGLLVATHATAWLRDRDQFVLDLHHTLPLVGASAEDTWRALDAHRATITVADAEVETLDRTASALMIALHAAHHGPRWKRAHTDLQRACALLDRECWTAAAQLARRLKADAAMGIGLGTVGDGRALADALGLTAKPTIAYRLRWWVSARREPDR